MNVDGDDRGMEKALQYTKEVNHLSRRTCTAILTNDVRAFQTLLTRAQKSLVCDYEIDPNLQLLGARRKLPALEVEHGAASLQALETLLADVPMPKVSAKDIWDKAKMLELLRGTYEGSLIHLAAALGRSDILSKITKVKIAKEYVSLALWCRPDVVGKTPVVWAVQRYHVGAVQVIVRHMLSLSEWESRKEVDETLVTAITTCTRLISRYPGMKSSVETLMRECRRLEPLGKHISLEWLVFTRRVEDLDEALFGVRRSTSLQRLASSTQPNLLHYAVFVYSQDPMTEAETQILDMLLTVGLDPNSVCSWDRGPLEDGVQGTTAHFALASYLPAALAAIHTGSPGGRAIERGPSYLDMLHFLLDWGADLAKPDARGKTPLDCLPPDAFPGLFHVLLDINGVGDEGEEKEEGEGGGEKAVKDEPGTEE